MRSIRCLVGTDTVTAQGHSPWTRHARSGDFYWPKPGTRYWPPLGTFSWPRTRVDYYYDGSLVGSVTRGVTDDPQYPVLNIGTGTWGGPVVTPSDMKVDYVRIWQQ